MNTVILIYGGLLIVLGIIGYIQSGSPTSFIGSAAGVLAIVGAYFYQTQEWAKWLCLVAALGIIGGLGARLPGAFSKISAGEATLGEYWVRFSLVGLSLLFILYFFFGLKQNTNAAS
jgi:uncharacterized membrane protein (UPF0136 family)